MPLAKNRELIQVSTQAHQHLKALAEAMEKNGIPTSGTKIASEAILSIPLPEVKVSARKRRSQKAQAEKFVSVVTA